MSTHIDKHKRRRLPRWGTMLGGLVLAGCASHTPLSEPALAVPVAWQQGGGVAGASAPHSAAAVDSASAPELVWWNALGDPVLAGLIAQARQHNADLAQAALRVRRAQLQAGLAASDLLPTVSVRGNTTATRPMESGGTTTRQHGVTGSVSWEADLWGRLSAARDAAQWEARATESDRQGVALALTATIARLYWQLGYLGQRVEASQQSIDYARRTVELVEAQYRAGAVSGLERAQAAQVLANQQAAHTQWLQQRTETRHALALLLGGTPGAALPEPAALPQAALPAVAAGLPAALLTRRPDVVAAEQRLRRAVAGVDTTRRAFYPTLTLTGSVGTASSELAEVLRNPVGTLGAGLLLPFVQWRDMQRNIAIARTDQELAVLSYRQTWYQALADVEDALSALQQFDAQGAQLALAAEAARDAERLSEARYRAGAVALKTWLDAQESRRQVDNSLALNRLNRLQARATLYQALGGEG